VDRDEHPRATTPEALAKQAMTGATLHVQGGVADLIVPEL
jgi:hypothetical protein